MIVLAFDTETTGLIDSRLKRIEFQPYVIQFCGRLIDCDAGTTISEYHTFIRPPMKENFKATDATKVTWEELERYGTFSDYFDAIAAVIGTAPAVAAHNLVFDRDILDVEARRIGKTFVWPSRQICTIELTSHVKGHRLSMTALHQELFGEDFAEAHDARADVGALTRCLIEFQRRDWL
jgi:DNA polymerase III alpha subunit (gram-positive type)